MTNKEFLDNLKEGDFITAVHITTGGKLVACFDSYCERDDMLDGRYHTIRTKFFIGYIGRFTMGIPFGCHDGFTRLRRATLCETFKLIDELRINGYTYNRKTRQICKKPV